MKQTYTDEMMRVFLNYYSFDNDGTKTISIKHLGKDGFDYVILSNGGVVMINLDKEDAGRAMRLCVEMGITISPVIEMGTKMVTLKSGKQILVRTYNEMGGVVRVEANEDVTQEEMNEIIQHI